MRISLFWESEHPVGRAVPGAAVRVQAPHDRHQSAGNHQVRESKCTCFAALAGTYLGAVASVWCRPGVGGRLARRPGRGFGREYRYVPRRAADRRAIRTTVGLGCRRHGDRRCHRVRPRVRGTSTTRAGSFRGRPILRTTHVPVHGAVHVPDLPLDLWVVLVDVVGIGGVCTPEDAGGPLLHLHEVLRVPAELRLLGRRDLLKIGDQLVHRVTPHVDGAVRLAA